MASTSVVFDILARDRASATFDKLGKSVGGTQTKMSKFTAVMAKAGKAAAYGLGAGIAAGSVALIGMTKNAVEDEAAQRKLATALRNSVAATDAQVASVEGWISKAAVAKGMTDDELRPAFQRLVESTGDIGKAQHQLQIAMDVSAGTGKSLKVVTEALMKANNGTTASLSKLGLKTKNAKGETLSLKDALKSMSETFKGQAEARAESLQGKMDRLKIIFDETKETIGAKLIPVATRLADWMLNTAIPAVQRFTDQWKQQVGAGGQVRAMLERVTGALQATGSVLGKVAGFANRNRGAMIALAAAIATVVAITKVHGAVMAVQAAGGLLKYLSATKLVTSAVKVWTAIQWALNVALTANPIGLVVAGIAALTAGVIIAYKKSETFRGGVQALWNWLKKLGAVTLGGLVSTFNSVKGVVSDVVGAVQSLVGWIGKLDLGKVGDIAGAIGGLPGKLFRRAGRDSTFSNAGDALIKSLVDSIKKGPVKLDVVMAKLGDHIKKHRDKLADLLSQRSGVVDAFKGFAESIFSTDLTVDEGEAPKGIQALLDFQKQQRANAEALAANVKSLIGKGLSKDLIQQLVDNGASGQAQIALLAGGSAAQIQQANADNAATQAALAAAGMTAGGSLYNKAIAEEQRDLRIAKAIEKSLDKWAEKQDKNHYVILRLQDKDIVASIERYKRQNGQ